MDEIELTRREIRVLVETCRRNEMGASETHDFISTAWGEGAVSLQTVYRLFQEVRENKRQKMDDAPHPGRPLSVRQETNVSLIRHLIKDYPYSTVNELAECTDISVGTVHRMLHEDLKLKHLCSRWVPHELLQHHKDNRVTRARKLLHTFKNEKSLMKRYVVIDEKWFHMKATGTKQSGKVWAVSAMDRPRVARQALQDKKIMAIVAICMDGKFHFELLEHGETVNAKRYIEFLRRMQHRFQKRKDRIEWEEILLQHDNARPHVANDVAEFLKSHDVTIVQQPAYSPDFNMCDRWLFARLEYHRRRRNFADSNDLHAYLTEQLKGVSKDDLQREMEKLQNDLTAIIHAGGDYL